MLASYREAASMEVGLPSFAFEFDLNYFSKEPHWANLNLFTLLLFAPLFGAYYHIERNVAIPYLVCVLLFNHGSQRRNQINEKYYTRNFINGKYNTILETRTRLD
jgi:hypothetical protein